VAIIRRVFLPALKVELLVVVVTGTVVMLLLSGDTVFFLAADRSVCGVGLIRRVLILPSGLLGQLELELLVCFGSGFRLCVLVGGRENADGHGDAGFKVQIDGLEGADKSF
jgi:hypothetical protein